MPVTGGRYKGTGTWAPGLERSYAAQKWACVSARSWMDAAEEAMDR